jgi:hypothetical protein
MIEELRRRSLRTNGIFLPLVIRTPKRKGPFDELCNAMLKEDYHECRYYSFLDLIKRQVELRLQ